jgi:hypothetical protein
MVIELCGFLGALAKATNPTAAIDVLGFAGALAAGTTAGLQMKSTTTYAHQRERP